MPDEGATEVGSIVGFLRIDDSDWNLVLDRADAKAKQVGRNSPKVTVKTNGVPEAIAALTALKAKEDEVSGSSSKMSKSVKDANDNAFRPLLTTALLLGPALAPLAVVGASVLGGLTLGGASLLLAFQGANTAIKEGTTLGQEYARGVQTIKSDLTSLQSQAAQGAIVPFNNAVADANRLMPTLSGEVRQFSGVTADAAEHLASGLISGFITLRPLLTDVINDVDRGATDFDHWSQSTGGIVRFMTLARAELPVVEQDISQVLLAVGHLGAAFGNTGLIGLNAIGLIARVINTIPVSQLDHVATAVTLMFGAWKAYQILNLAKDGFDKVSQSIGNTVAYFSQSTLAVKANDAAMELAAARGSAFAVATDGVATALATEKTEAQAATAATAAAGAASEAAEISMSAALGPLGLLAAGIGIVAFAWTQGHGPSVQATQDVQDYTDALRADNGAIADNTKALAAKKLVETGVIDDARKLGISTEDLTQALLGNKDAQSRVQDAVNKASAAWNAAIGTGKGATSAQRDLEQASEDLQTKLGAQESAFSSSDAAVQKLQATYAALGLDINGVASSTSSALTPTMQLANAYKFLLSDGAATANTAADSLIQAMDTYSKSAGTAADKAALLGAVLVASQGDALSYAGAISAGYAATQALVSTFQQQASATVSTSGTVNAQNASVALDKVTAATSRLNAAQIAAGGPQKSAAAAASAAASVESASAALAAANAALDKASQPVGGVKASETFANTEKAAIDLTTGLINLKAQGAAPLVQQLQAMQDAAEKAAEATYQHEVQQKGDNQALQDAQDIFESLTGGALVENAKQLGLTKDQAKLLADQYFTFDGKTVSTTVQSVGLSTINDTLNQIGQLLAKLTGQQWTIPVSLETNAMMADVAGKGLATAGHHAGGGYLSEGWNTAGEGSATELMYKQGSTVKVFTHQQSLPMLLRNGANGVPGPGIGSPAAQAVHAAYQTPAFGAPAAAPAAPQLAGTLHHTTVVMLDGKVLTTVTNEHNLADARRT